MKLFVHQLDNLDNYIQINLLDNPAIKRWFDYFINVQEISGSINNMPLGNRPDRLLTKNYHDTQYQLLIDTIHQLKQLQLPIVINFPEIPNVFNYDQHWCNHIHNIFVDIIKYLSSVSFHDRYSNPDFIEIERVATQLNTVIHDLEYDSRTTATEKFCSELYQHEYLQTFINTEKNKEIEWFEFTVEEQQLYHADNHSCNVVFGNNILGKTYFVSFLQEEDIDSPSTSGVIGTWSDIEILLDQNRKHIYNSLKFKNWLSERSLPMLVEFPIGNVDASCDLTSFAKKIAGEQFIYRFKN